MNTNGDCTAQGWRTQLEIIGPALFLRYRKRLPEPGILWEIRRDYPGLRLLDIAVRVHAGRRLIDQGQDFVALQAIRSGRWRSVGGQPRARFPGARTAGDRLSRSLVGLGGGLVAAYCLVSLGAALGADLFALGVLGLVLAGQVAMGRHRGGQPR